MATRCAAAPSYAEVPSFDVAVCGELGRRTGEDDRPLVHDEDTLPDLGGEAEVLLDKKKGEPGGAQPFEDLADLLDELRRESLGGLVEEQDRGVSHERPRDREHLLLAAGQLVATHRATAGEDREELHYLGLVPAIRDRPRGDGDVLADGQIAEDAAALGYERDACASDLMGRRGGEIGAIDVHAPTSRSQKARDRGDRRRLARTIAADERHGFSRGDVEINALQDMAFAVVGMEPADREGECAHATVTAFPRYTSLTRTSPRTSAAVPSAMTRPSCRTVTRSASRKTTSMSCSTIRIVRVRSRPAMRSVMRAVSSGDMPAVGSSRRRTRGRCASATASSS